MSATLNITEATGRTWKTQIRPGKTWTIGRAKDNDIVLNDRRASRKHAFIEMNGLDFQIVDGSIEDGQLVRSVNHVFVNGTMREEHKLTDGDVIIIGESSLEFRITPDVKSTRDLSPFRNPSQIEIEKPKGVSFDDAPLGHTQVAVSVNELMGRKSDLSLENAIVTAQEAKDLRRKAKILELLYEMSRTLGTVLELDELFSRVTDLIFRGTPADRVVALLADEQTGELEQMATRVRDESIQKLTENLAVSRTITNKVMKDRVAILSQDAKTDEQFQGAESIVSQGVRSTICAPLITQS
ncbi:MAG: FHA domain-containing protein, partial [Acidobacteria bacterium]|nr:FHA domain-containing protein [Acidobacteriota bacterium]